MKWSAGRSRSLVEAQHCTKPDHANIADQYKELCIGISSVNVAMFHALNSQSKQTIFFLIASESVFIVIFLKWVL